MHPQSARRLFASLLAPLFSLALASVPAAAQRSDAEIRDEVAFARGLASDWGFVDLAEKVIMRMERDGVSTRMKEELGLAKCDIYAEGARRNPDPAERDRLLMQAIESYESFIETHPFSVKKDEAEGALVDTAYTFARSLSARLEDAVGEERTELTERLDVTLKGALDKTGDLVAALEANPERSEAENREYYDLLFNRGGMLLLLAKTQEEGTLRFQQSFDAYEKLAAEAGEGSPYGLRAYIGIGDVYAAQDEWSDASDFYLFVTDIAIPSDAAAWRDASKDMNADEKQRRFLFMQLGTAGLIESLAKAGDLPAACVQGLRFYNILSSEGLELVPPYGDLSMIALARVLVDSGGFVGGSSSGGNLSWYETREDMEKDHSNRRNQRAALDLSLSIAQQTNERNRGNVLQVRAQNLIADIISRPGVEVAPSLLAEAAQGKYNDGDYQGAVDSYKRVLAALENADEIVRADNGAGVLHYLGRSLQRMDRHLEAALVFEEAVDRWEDPNFDENNAKGFYDSMRQVKRQVKSDPIVEALFKKSEQALEDASTGKGAGEIAYRRAEKAYRERDYAGALDLFGKVPDNAPSYEKAIAYQGVCHYKLDQYDDAKKSFDEYLNRFLQDPLKATTDPRALAKRQEARATATFYWGLSLFQQEDWQQVIAVLGSFNEDFPQQDAFAPAAMYRVLMAQQNLKQGEAVEATYKKMLAVFPESSWTGRAATDIYQGLRTEREALLTSDPEGANKLLRDMARYMKVSNDASADAPFNNLRLESMHWMELEDWETAEEVLERVESRFAQGAQADDVRKHVIPDLGKAYYEQKKAKEAADVLRPLVDDDSFKTTAESAHIYARCVTGWAELDESGDRKQIVRVPGVATEVAEFEQATKLLDQLAAGEEKWTLPWLALQFDNTYAYFQWAQLDGKKLEAAKNQLKIMKIELGGERFLELEDKRLRELFTWLAGQVR